ncbi:hypothetical protein [Streptomyces sp. NPDC002913]
METTYRISGNAIDVAGRRLLRVNDTAGEAQEDRAEGVPLGGSGVYVELLRTQKLMQTPKGDPGRRVRAPVSDLGDTIGVLELFPADADVPQSSLGGRLRVLNGAVILSAPGSSHPVGEGLGPAGIGQLCVGRPTCRPYSAGVRVLNGGVPSEQRLTVVIHMPVLGNGAGPTVRMPGPSTSCRRTAAARPDLSAGQAPAHPGGPHTAWTDSLLGGQPVPVQA